MQKRALADYSASSSSSSSPARSSKRRPRSTFRERSRSKSKPNHHRSLPYNNNQGNKFGDFRKNNSRRDFQGKGRFGNGRGKNDKLLDILEKEKEADEYEQWLIKEDDFLKKQMVEQSRIRINLKRMNPIDFFAKILFIFKGAMDLQEEDSVEMLKTPGVMLNRMSKEDIESVIKQAEIFQKIEDTKDFKAFWGNVRGLAMHKMSELRLNDVQDKGRVEIKSSISEEYKKEIDKTLKGKNLEELNGLEKQAMKIINSNKFKVDVEFWEEMLQKIKIKRYNLELADLYVNYYERKIDKEKEKMMRMHTKNPKLKEKLVRDDNSPVLLSFDIEKELDWINILKEEEYVNEIQVEREKIFDQEIEGLVGKMKTNLEQKKRKELEQRKMVGADILLHNENNDIEGISLNDEEKWFKKIMQSKGEMLNDDDQSANTLFDLEQKKYDWIDKFRPRKPHYFNRVRMGYEWNKVNQTHYDLDAPPPKQVLGYKFNIFYPNLIDNRTTPKYSLEPCDNHDYCVIKFSAGPPYEDIAFKIVNKEWDLSDRHGFKCVFDRGILHLHFNFVKVRYRR